MPRLRISIRSLLLATAVIACAVWIYQDWDAWQKVGEIFPDATLCQQTALSRDGRLLAVNCLLFKAGESMPSHLHVWHIEHERLRYETNEYRSVYFFRMSSDGRRLAILNVLERSSTSPRQDQLMIVDMESRKARQLRNSTEIIHDATFCGEEVLAVAEEFDPAATLGSPSLETVRSALLCFSVTDNQVRKHELDSAPISIAAFSHDGRSLITICNHASGIVLKCWNTTNGQLRWQRELSEHNCNHGIWSADDRQFVLHCLNGSWLLAATTGEGDVVPDATPPSTTVSPDLKRGLYSAFQSGTVEIRRWPTGEELGKIETGYAGVMPQFSEDGRHIVVENAVGNGIQVWRRIRPEGLAGWVVDFRAWLAAGFLLALVASLCFDLLRLRNRPNSPPAG